MASTYLSRTPASATNRKTFTYSTWIKRSGLSSQQYIFNAYSSGDNNGYAGWRFNADDTITFTLWSAGILKTTQVFRDTSAWYHLVFTVDTTEASADDRANMYINGEQITSYSDNSRSNLTLNMDLGINTAANHAIGTSAYNTTSYFDGEMAHCHFIDGTVYDASAFGETDATTGIWKPKTAPSVTYGTNGFFLKFENSGAFGTDSSGNGNNFTVNGTMTQTIDTPSNVFATLNPLSSITSPPTFSNGNTVAALPNASTFGAITTLGVSKGKYYAEFKKSVTSDDDMIIGIISDLDDARINYGAGASPDSYGYRETGNKLNNGSDVAYGDSYGTTDIVSIALDLDNNYIYFAKNGTWQNSGDPTSGATGTGAAFSIGDASTTPSGNYFFATSCGSPSQSGTWQCNFGNGYFGTTAVSSAQNPDDGIGIFEYDVPAGYRALCTKSINAEEYS